MAKYKIVYSDKSSEEVKADSLNIMDGIVIFKENHTPIKMISSHYFVSIVLVED